MSTPHEVARDLRDRMESAKRAASNPEAGSVYAFNYLLSACEAACARLDLQAGSGEQDQAKALPDLRPAPAAGEGTSRACADYGCACRGDERYCVAPVVSDAEAEAVADSLVGQPVDSHVPRAYVGPGPERLKARLRW